MGFYLNLNFNDVQNLCGRIMRPAVLSRNKIVNNNELNIIVKMKKINK